MMASPLSIMSLKSVLITLTIIPLVVSFSTKTTGRTLSLFDVNHINKNNDNRFTLLNNSNKNIIVDGNKDTESDESVSLQKRRNFLLSGATSLILSSSLLTNYPGIAEASGGATAGKYTTIPIAKRRYYGRVQQAVHEFLEMGPEVVKGDLKSAVNTQRFFDVTATVIIPAKDYYINGSCTKKDGNCKGKEIRDSRYNDMKATMYLLGNAFRINQQKAPDNLPTVKAAKAFFIEMDALEKVVKKPKKGDDAKFQQLYVKALTILDGYLDLVELPPIDSGHYEQEFSTLVGRNSRLT